jgi:hypothetical protein
LMSFLMQNYRSIEYASGATTRHAHYARLFDI